MATNDQETGIGQEMWEEFRPSLGIAAMVVGVGAAALSAINGTHITDGTLVVKHVAETAAFTANGLLIAYRGLTMVRGSEIWSSSPNTQGNEQPNS